MSDSNVIEVDFGHRPPLLTLNTRTEMLYIDDEVALYRVTIEMNGTQLSRQHFALPNA